MSAQERFVARQAVFVMLTDGDGRILLQQRCNTGYLDGYWDFAASGHVEYGESLQEAALRELKEEIDITASPEDLRLIHVDQFYMDKDYINWTFVLDKWQGEPIIKEPHKCSAMQFFDPDSLPKKCVNTVRACATGSFDNGKVTFSVTNNKTWTQLMGES